MKRNHRLAVDSAEYAELVSILTHPEAGGVLILGGLGIGKTTLVRAVLDREDIPEPAMRIYCSPALAGEPFGALSPYLSSHAPADSPAQVLREINAVLAAHPGEPPIVVVEDAEFVDEQTSFVLSALVENAAIKLVAVGPGRADGECALFALAESGLLSTLAVQPLRRQEVRFLAEELTGASLTSAAVDAVAAMTGGNPRFIEAFIQSCLDQGLIIADDGRTLLTLARIAPEPDETLIELVRDVARTLPSAQRTALEILALAGPQPSPVSAEHRRLIDAGILVLDSGLVRIASDIHAVVLRSIIAPSRSAQLFASWREHSDVLTPPQVLWALEVGAHVPAQRVLTAIEEAGDSLDFPLAWKLIGMRAAGDSDRSALLEARTLLGLGRHYSAAAVLMRLTERSSDPAILQQVFDLLILTLDQLGSLRADLKEIERIRASRGAPQRQ